MCVCVNFSCMGGITEVITVQKNHKNTTETWIVYGIFHLACE